ncbi:MAG: hypothetical protein V4596_09355 [Bdellovibrionota bacterium]
MDSRLDQYNRINPDKTDQDKNDSNDFEFGDLASNNFEPIEYSSSSFENIPLPNQIPQPSFETSKSRAMQTLLSQNQDLMARLTVSLKRNIELEQKIDSQEEIYHSIASQYDILKDQSSVNVEKNKHLEFENQKLYEQTSAVEKRFAELYSAYQDKVNYIQKISYRLHRYLQYRKRIKAFVRPFITNLKAEIVNLKNQILVLNEQGIKQLEFITDLKKKYSDALDRIQAINVQNERTQMDLTQYHDIRFQEISKEFETLKIETASLQSQNVEYKTSLEALKENEAALSNKSIFFERKYTDLKNEFEQISQEFIQQKTLDNNKLTTLEIQLREISGQYAKVSEQKAMFETENRQMNDQLQSMQLIYQDNTIKMDELNKKNTAQDQINKELSQSLLESRKKAEFLEQKLLVAEEEFKRKLQAFQVRFNKIPAEPISFAQTEQTKAGQKDLLNKIQNLLSEIQTGHSHQSQISNIEFEETSKNESGELISEFGDIQSNS